MNFQIACGKSNIYDSPQPKPSTAPNIFNTFYTSNKETLDIHNDHLSYHRVKNSRYKSINRNQSNNYFVQMSALNVQNIYAAIKKQTKLKDTDVMQQLTRSLNGTWFKNIMSQTCQYGSSSLYTTLGLRRSQEKRKKKNPLIIQSSMQKQYREPNKFPARRATSLNLYSSNSRQHRKLAVDFNAFRSVEVEGKGLESVNQEKTKNQGWLKGQIIKNVTNMTLDQKEQQKQKNRKSRVSMVQSSRDRNRDKPKQEFVLLSKKAKLNS